MLSASYQNRRAHGARIDTSVGTPLDPAANQWTTGDPQRVPQTPPDTPSLSNDFEELRWFPLPGEAAAAL